MGSGVSASWFNILGRERARPAWLREWPHFCRRSSTPHWPRCSGCRCTYLLALTTLLIPVGRLADVHGRKLTYLYGFVMFTAAPTACGLAPSLGTLIGLRVIQAIEAAMIPGQQRHAGGHQRPSAPDAAPRWASKPSRKPSAWRWASPWPACWCPRWGWRWVFGINSPSACWPPWPGSTSCPALSTVPLPGGGTAVSWCWWRARPPSLLLGISVVSGLSLPRWAAIVLLGSATATAGGFVARQRQAATPLIDLALPRRPGVGTGLAGALGGYLVLFGPLVLIPVTLTAAGSSMLHAGLVLTALPARFALAATAAERLLPARWSDRPAPDPARLTARTDKFPHLWLSARHPTQGARGR